MKWSRSLSPLACLAVLAACSGGGGKNKTLLDGAAGDATTKGDGSESSAPRDADGNAAAGSDASNPGAGEAGQGTLIPTDGSIPFPVNSAGQVLCGGVPCNCSDGEDDDGDGLTDLADPECVSSWDNDETSFATGISGDNRDDACQDCFFDGNSGSGNDGCRLPSSCLTDGNPSSGQGSCSKCEQSAQCVNFCQAYTPNGCDCFGCCDVRLANDTTVHVMLSSGCNIDGNTVSPECQTCVPNDSCGNTCGKCELCPGKTLADLPAECFTHGSDGGAGGGTDGGGGTVTNPPAYTCDGGEQRCGAGLSACGSAELCQYGCCVLAPIVL